MIEYRNVKTGARVSVHNPLTCEGWERISPAPSVVEEKPEKPAPKKKRASK